MEAAVILGAGFSKNTGLPVQSEIPPKLISHEPGDIFEEAVSSILKSFMKDIFGYEGDIFPNLDDMFTCIDISTSSGHHLGVKYSPLHLRAIRRLLVYRVFSILECSFTFSQDVQNFIKALFARFSRVSFIVLNWDTVLEEYIHSLAIPGTIDYNNNGLCWEDMEQAREHKWIKILKLHGSSNWIYCDNCRSLYNDLEGKIPLIRRAGFQELDFQLFPELSKLPPALKESLYEGLGCRQCGNPVSSHIATFSYRKSFRVNSFSTVWHRAEEELARSGKWIFVGYSLPDADYEFKHLLKISQHKLKHISSRSPEIDVILLNSDNTLKKYQQFFGDSISNIFNDGIKGYIKNY